MKIKFAKCDSWHILPSLELSTRKPLGTMFGKPIATQRVLGLYWVKRGVQIESEYPWPTAETKSSEGT